MTVRGMEPLIEKAHRPGLEQTSPGAMVANFVTNCLGIGILTVPWSAAGASTLPGAFVTLALLGLNAYTCNLIVEAGERHQIFEMGLLLNELPEPWGPVLRWAYNGILWCGLLLCLVGYLVLIPDVLLPLLPGPDMRQTLACITAMVCTPLCFLRQQYLAMSSALAIAINVYILGLVAYLSISAPWDGPAFCELGWGRGILSMSCVLMMGTSNQPLVLPMYETLQERSPAGMRRVIFSGYAIIALLYIGLQVAGARGFGPFMAQNLLVSLPDTWTGNLARLGMCGVVPGAYALKVLQMVAPLKAARSEHASEDRSALGYAAELAPPILISVVVFGISSQVNQLGVLNEVNGALMGLMFAAVAPCMLGWRLMHASPAGMVALGLGGSLVSLSGIWFRGNYVQEVLDNCLVTS